MGRSAGYNSKLRGGIIGVDATVNDDLTTIGLAIANSRTDIKFKDYMLGVKSKVRDWIFSIYGLHEIREQWFVEGIAMYSRARVKTREPRYELGVFKTALSNYKYKIMGGDINRL